MHKMKICLLGQSYSILKRTSRLSNTTKVGVDSGGDFAMNCSLQRSWVLWQNVSLQRWALWRTGRCRLGPAHVFLPAVRKTGWSDVLHVFFCFLTLCLLLFQLFVCCCFEGRGRGSKADCCFIFCRCWHVNFVFCKLVGFVCFQKFHPVLLVVYYLFV